MQISPQLFPLDENKSFVKAASAATLFTQETLSLFLPLPAMADHLTYQCLHKCFRPRAVHAVQSQHTMVLTSSLVAMTLWSAATGSTELARRVQNLGPHNLDLFCTQSSVYLKLSRCLLFFLYLHCKSMSAACNKLNKHLLLARRPAMITRNSKQLVD